MGSLTPASIPGPRPYPIVGNITDLDPTDAVASLGLLARKYGSIYRLSLAGSTKVFISSRDLVDEVSDESRFTKLVSGPLFQLRNCCGDSLFTAQFNEHNWDVAHRVLMPAFGPLAIKGMFNEMHDVASQLVVKWARFGPKETINVTDDFTRLTLDTIALCSMGTRFNSFYKEEMHPFVGSMIGLLQESGKRAARPGFANYFMPGSVAQYEADIATLHQIAADVLAERRQFPTDKKDLLNAMIRGRDPKSGEGLSDESILNNMIVFLIAGHETTSGMLSFLFYYFLKLPHVFKKAQEEVDRVAGRGPITIEHMAKLPYLEACLRETLRLHPTAPVITLQARPDLKEETTLIGGKYEVARGQGIVALLIEMQRDPKVWGEDADQFNAERMLDENFNKLPKNSWKPFGNGVRGCIGRAFAWQESLLIIAMLLQNFNFCIDDDSYQLKIKQTLTIKPGDLFMHATLRDHVDSVHLEKVLHGSAPSATAQKGAAAEISAADQASLKPMTILYGSDSGTCEAMAHSLGRVAPGRGYRASIAALDTAVGSVPKDEPVIVISSSYNGSPPSNATQFVNWLESLKGKTLQGVRYAVYGCGNRDYTDTFHRVPKLLDSVFEKNGGSRLAETGLTDVVTNDIFNDFEKWQDEQLWPALGADQLKDGVESGLEIRIESDGRPVELRQDVQQATVLTNNVLTAPGEPEKRSLSVKLPTGLEYQAGDHLTILPLNDWAVVRRVFRWANLPEDAVVTIVKGVNTSLPTGRATSVRDLLSGYVELSQPATRKNITRMAAAAADPCTKARLGLLERDFENSVRLKRRSVLDILEEFPSTSLTFADFLSMLPPMHARQYSVASSPLSDPSTATLIWSVLDKESLSLSGRRFLGVASNYLANLQEGERIHVSIKPALRLFHAPADSEKTPVVMACAGTGLAPFRAFVQERAIQIKKGQKLAPAYLFVGCRHPERDALLKQELQEWEELGCVKVLYAFSQASDQSEDCRYVQHRMWHERDVIKKALGDGANFYVCGSAEIGKCIEHVMKRVYEDGEKKGDADQWLQELKATRYATELFT